MKLSYLIFSHDETDTLKTLLDTVLLFVGDNEIIISDDFSTNPKTLEILDSVKNLPNVQIVKYKLENSYADKKNKALSHCKNPFVITFDGDECPTKLLLNNISEIIESNPDNQAYFVTRLNNFEGIMPEHATQWGWRLTISTSLINERVIHQDSDEYQFLKFNDCIIEETVPSNDKGNKKLLLVKYKAILINFPDFQCRIFRNNGEIKWFGNLHERIVGNKNHAYLPQNEDLALIHSKSITKQLETNHKYNEKFTEEDNKGFILPH